MWIRAAPYITYYMALDTGTQAGEKLEGKLSLSIIITRNRNGNIHHLLRILHYKLELICMGGSLGCDCLAGRGGRMGKIYYWFKKRQLQMSGVYYFYSIIAHDNKFGFVFF